MHPNKKLIQLKPGRLLILAAVFYVVIAGGLTWHTILNPDKGMFTCLFAIHILSLFGMVKLSTYRLTFYDDRIVKKLWNRMETLFYEDVEYLCLENSGNDADYPLFSVWIKSVKKEIHFRTKWFDTREQANQVMELLMEKCDADKVKEGKPPIMIQLKEMWGIVQWMLMFGVLMAVGSLLF